MRDDSDMASPFLYFADDRLSLAELTAACLDGDLVDLGHGYIPADAVETAALRAESLLPLVGEGLAATHLSAAWIHGFLHALPSRHTLQRASATRGNRLPPRSVVYRDLQVDQAQIVRIGGVQVTTALKTLCDLSRVADPEHRAAAARLIEDDPHLVPLAIEQLHASALPHKREALRMLRAGRTSQEDVTR